VQDGRLLFAHYAFMPNRLGYCGGGDNQTLFDYCTESAADPGLEGLLRQFQAAYPYLKFIANSNGLANPFDRRVVEAYWVGNDLLEGVDMVDFHHYLAEKVGPRVSQTDLRHLLGKPPAGAHPHHSFHVLDVSMKTGALKETIEDLDRCRISWGEVASAQGDILTVVYRPLVLVEGKLALAQPARRQVRYRVDGRGYLATPAVGDVVSMHWDWVCDALTPQQAARLERQTRHHLALANQTL
jgi:hypothetical protein